MRTRAFISLLVLTAILVVSRADELKISDSTGGHPHWAYVAPRRPKLPHVRQITWPLNPIDHFTLAGMERHQMSPSQPAMRERWLRRVTFDLTGLPPTLGEIDAFLADSSPGAFSRVVDRLLSSPYYGERLALHWLDLARYADTHGFHADAHRDMWRWRDWVIEAFNENMPFDQFTIWQIAGDMLPDATLTQRIASGFNRNHMINFENGAIAEEYRTEYVIDRVVTTSTVWLGQTMLCARCHDHPYDPFTQRDFYRMFAYFNNVPEEGLDGRKGNATPLVKAPTHLQKFKLARLDSSIDAIEQKLEQRATTAGADQLAWEHKFAEGGTKAEPPVDMSAHFPLDEAGESKDINNTQSPKAANLKGTANWIPREPGNALLFDGETYIDAGKAVAFDRSESFSFGIWIMPTTGDDMAIMSCIDGSETQRGFELMFEGKSIVVRLVHDPDNRIVVNTKSKLALYRWQHISVTYDGTGSEDAVCVYVDGKPQELQTTQGNLTETIRTDEPLLIGCRDKQAFFRGLMDDIRFYARQLSSTEVELLAGSDPIAAIVGIAPANRDEKQRKTLQTYYLENHDSAYKALIASLNDFRKARQKVTNAISTTMVMQEMASPRDTFILGRGNYQNRQEQVSPGVPASLNWSPNEVVPDRHGLAQWLVDRANPITARVVVNRFWQMHFGEGLVRTPEDFGTRGERPTHSALLDWLAVEFMDSGWDVKHLQRLIVLSATYRQSSRVTPALLARDPHNRLLARGPRHRLQAEFIRDAALFAGGLLDHRIGGRSVYPYQPAGLWKDVSYFPRNYTAQVYRQSHGSDLYRRGMYTFWKRSVPPPSLAVLGAPNREICTVRRPRPSTPLDALALMNDPTYVEAARGLGQRMIREGGDSPRERIAFGFRLATARRPKATELLVLLDTFHEQLRDFQNGAEVAYQLLNVGESKYNESVDVSELATYTVIASMILNLHETITKS